MIIGFLIIGKIGFISFEHYFENFSQYVRSKSPFFDFVENTRYEVGIFSFDRIALEIIDAGQKILVGIVYLKSKSLNLERKNQLIQIAIEVSQGDKMTTHKVLKSKYASEILY